MSQNRIECTQDQLRRLCIKAGLPLLATPISVSHATGKLADTAVKTAANRSTNAVKFALIGDTPYSNADERNLRLIMTAAARETSFTIHIGDLKGGQESCHEDLLAQRINLLDESTQPLFVIPGDNEWVDCNRFTAGRYDPVERLRMLRLLLYRGRLHLGRGQLAAERGPVKAAKSELSDGSTDGSTHALPDGTSEPEFMRWRAGPCLFVTLNVPGTYNGLNGHISDRFNRDRARKNQNWLYESVALANRDRLAGLVIVLHAHVQMNRLGDWDFDVGPVNPKNPYGAVRAMVARATGQFAGKTMLLYGDRHQFGVDNPLREYAAQLTSNKRWGQPLSMVKQRLHDFQAIQCFGSPFSAQYVTIRAWTEAANPNVLKTLVATRSI